VKAPIAALSILVLAACAHPASAPVRGVPVAKKNARVPIVVREATSVQDFWSGTLARPLRMSAARGSIRASAVYPNPSPYHSRVRVTDGGRSLLDTVTGDVPMGWHFGELEGHRPVLLFDGFTGGAHCCFDTTVVPIGNAGGRVTRIDWGDPGYALRESAAGSGSVFVTADKAMAYAFGSFAASTFAIKVVTVRDGVVRDVTGEYPALIERDARDQWATYLKRKHDPDALAAEREPPLVAYLADEYRLGGGSAAWAYVRAVNGPAPAFYTKALAWLREHGYAG